MIFAIFTHVNHIQSSKQYFAYMPYIREMNIWLKYSDKILIVAPLQNKKPTTIDSSYNHKNIDFRKVPDFSVTNFKNGFISLFKIPIILHKMAQAMYQADHIHLRCPGNMGLLACVVQIFFPYKVKTAKYAGNWDPKAKQPWTYRLQKWILSNTFLTRNMQVLVYGEWENQSKNIVPFFTATYSESDKEAFQEKLLNQTIHFIFVGTLAKGKNPLYAIQLVEELFKKGYSVHLDLYGEGIERENLERYIINSNLRKVVELKGNHSQDIVKEAYKNSHFVILPSKSEGWPKAIAEGMFWGCVPIATEVSCVPFMLDFGNRGLLLKMDLKQDVSELECLLNNQLDFAAKSQKAFTWSGKYTIDVFENEIKKLLSK
ncbi:MAG: glycosyltransferase [Flavobacterium sp.]